MSLREAAPGGDRTEFTMIPAWDELNSFGQSPGQMPERMGGPRVTGWAAAASYEVNLFARQARMGRAVGGSGCCPCCL